MCTAPAAPAFFKFKNMVIRNIIKRIAYRWQYYKIKRVITVKGSHHNFGPTAHISLVDGSNKDDIVLDDYVDVFGLLMSQSHGKITIGHHSRISRNVSVQCVDSISIGNNVIISRESVVCDSNNHPLSVLFRRVWSTCFNMPGSDMHLAKYASHKPIIIKDNVWIGERSRICKGVTIGNNCVIGANSVVTKDVPDNCIAAGNPAKVVKTDIDKIADPTDCITFNEYIRQYGSYF